MNTSYTINRCAIIILAAGGSVRLGTPKQLLEYKGQSLMENMVVAAIETSLQPVIVVTGASASKIMIAIKNKRLEIANNANWEEGMASSINCGIVTLQKKYPLCDGALIMVCDQPYITSGLLTELVSIQKKSLKPIAACRYENTIGTPAVFHKTFFPALLSLKGDKGARKILKENASNVVTIEFPMGRFDIDTQEDYDRLQSL